MYQLIFKKLHILKNILQFEKYSFEQFPHLLYHNWEFIGNTNSGGFELKATLEEASFKRRISLKSF